MAGGAHRGGLAGPGRAHRGDDASVVGDEAAGQGSLAAVEGQLRRVLDFGDGFANDGGVDVESGVFAGAVEQALLGVEDATRRVALGARAARWRVRRPTGVSSAFGASTVGVTIRRLSAGAVAAA